MRSIRRAGALVIDCDSTLVTIEGIEALARTHHREVEALTEAAMRGEVPLEEVYGRRLELVRPGHVAIEALGHAYIASMVPDAAAVIAALRDEGITVRILSGGLRPAVVTLARELGLTAGDVEAVGIRFDADGAYAGFDTASPLARSGGKREVVSAWRSILPAPLTLVGDGATDLEAADVADLFIAYTGVIDRPNVSAAADAVVRSLSLAPILPLALGGEPPRDSTHAALYERGLALLDARTRGRLSSNRGQRT